MKSVCSHSSSSLLFVMKVMVWHFVSCTLNSQKVMTALIVMLLSCCSCGDFFAISWICSQQLVCLLGSVWQKRLAAYHWIWKKWSVQFLGFRSSRSYWSFIIAVNGWIIRISSHPAPVITGSDIRTNSNFWWQGQKSRWDGTNGTKLGNWERVEGRC